jgi:hypothetical protein
MSPLWVAVVLAAQLARGLAIEYHRRSSSRNRAQAHDDGSPVS